VNADLKAGIEWALAEAHDIPARISAAQAYIAQHHSPSHIADLWERVLDA
jgi:hypothetical protein